MNLLPHFIAGGIASGVTLHTPVLRSVGNSQRRKPILMKLKSTSQTLLVAVGLTVSGPTLQGAAVSGTITYPGTQRGPVWVTANPAQDTNWVLNVDGAGDYLADTTNAALNLTTNVTLEAWIKVTSFNDWAGLITKGTSKTAYSLNLWSDGSLRFYAGWGSPAGGSGYVEANSNLKMTPGRWYHTAVVYDGSKITFYIDGQADANVVNANVVFGILNEPLVLGADWAGAPEYFNGSMDEVRVWNRPLSASEIQQNMRRRLSGAEAGLVSYWRFDDGLLLDATPNANHGALFGNANPSVTTVAGFLGNATRLDAPGAYSIGTVPAGISCTAFAFRDSTDDGLPDAWEARGAYAGNPFVLAGDRSGVNIPLADDTATDSDGDGLADYFEVYTSGTDPDRIDTDGDGLSDGAEVNTYHTGPVVPDSDGDGLSDGEEVLDFGSSPVVPDTDGDDQSDGVEIANGTSPSQASSFTTAISGTVTYGGTQSGVIRAFAARSDWHNRVLYLDGVSWARRDIPILPTGGVCTVEAWVYPMGYPDGTWSGIVSWGPRACGAATGQSLEFALQNSGRISFGTWCNDFVPGSGPAVTLNTWNHVAAVMNRRSVTLYVNGAPIPGTFPYDPNLRSSSLALGATDYPGRFFHGMIDEVRIWNRPFTSGQVLSHMRGTFTGREPGLMAYYRFDDGTASDASTNQNELAFQNHADVATVGLTSFGEFVTTIPSPSAFTITNVANQHPYRLWAYCDSDGDGALDPWEAAGSLASEVLLTNALSGALITLVDPIGDSDGDGLTDYHEHYISFTDLENPDTDGDGLNDGQEVDLHRTNPLDPDTDHDGLGDQAEVISHHTSPLLADSDGDQLPDYFEVMVYHTTPTNSVDFDSDGWSDGLEVLNGSDPTTAASSLTTLSGVVAYSGPQTGAVWVAAMPVDFANRALNLNGASAHVNVGDRPALDLRSALTLEAWVNPRVASGDHPIVAKEGGGGRQAYWFGVFQDRFGLLLGNGSGWGLDARSSGLVSTGLWTHLAVTWDGANWACYQNGALVGAGAYAGTLPDSPAPLQLGQNSEYASTHFNGLLEEVRIWRRALTGDEIRAGLLRKLSGAEVDLVGLWSFDEGTAADHSVFAQHGTLQSGAVAAEVGPPGYPSIRARRAGPGPFTLANVPTGNRYALTAFLDTSGEEMMQSDEPQGVCALNPVTATAPGVANLNVTLGGCDFQTVYATDFESDADAAWSVPTLSSNVAFSSFLGRFGNQGVTLTLHNLPSHELIRLNFDLYLIDSWDAGGDLFGLSGDLTRAWSFRNYAGTQGDGYPGTPDVYAPLDFTLGFTDSIYRDLRDNDLRHGIVFAHTGETLTVTFYGQGLQELNDESWGLDNVRVALGGRMRVLPLAPEGHPDVLRFPIRFGQPVQAGTFTLADVSLTGPGGVVTPLALTPRNAGAWDLDVTPDNGLYTLQIGPTIQSQFGGGLDQDGDGLALEPVDDIYRETFEAVFQPDLQIRRAIDYFYLGDGLYDANAADQGKVTEALAGQTSLFYLRLVNDGTLRDQVTVTATTPSAGWAAACYDAVEGGTDIWGSLSGAGWDLTLEPGQMLNLRLEMTSSGSVPEGSTAEILIRATSQTRAFSGDAVKASVHVPAPSSAARGATFEYNEDFERGVMVGLCSVDGMLEWSGAQATLPFIWIPNSDNATVSKVDVRTGRELARYRVAPVTYANPSRTTVDQYGNCWVANRQSAAAVKIGLFEAGQYEDRNHNGVIDTSRDLNSDGSITGAEELPWGQDECVLRELILIPGNLGTYVPGTYTGSYANDYWNPGPRGVAIDEQNNLWIGAYGSMKYYYVHGLSGTLLRTVDVAPLGHHPYGAVIDANGILWSASWTDAGGDGNLLRLDPRTEAIGEIDLALPTYGMGLDTQGHLFVANMWNWGLSRIDVNTGTIDWEKTRGSTGTESATGVAVTEDGDVWVASTGYGNVDRYSNDGVLKASIPVGSPRGVAVDAEGYVWALNRSDQFIRRIDPRNNTVVLSKQLAGSSHYGYSDMTGFLLNRITSRRGTWDVVHDSSRINAPWGRITWVETRPPGTSVHVEARSSNDRQSWSDWQTAANDQVLTATPPGRYLEVRVTLQAQPSGNNLPTLDRLTITPVGDADGDGLPDDWEQQYFGSPTAGVAGADPDGDRMSNWEEFVAGTVPTNLASALILHVPASVEQINPFVLSWASTSNRFYSVYDSTNLARGFTPRAFHLPATAPLNFWTNHTAEPAHFFRIRVD